MTFKLRVDQSLLHEYGSRYAADDPLEVEAENVLGPAVRARGYYTRDEIIEN